MNREGEGGEPPLGGVILYAGSQYGFSGEDGADKAVAHSGVANRREVPLSGNMRIQIVTKTCGEAITLMLQEAQIIKEWHMLSSIHLQENTYTM